MAKQKGNVQGFEELERALHKLPLIIRRDIAIEGTKKAANYVARTARGLAPEGDFVEYVNSEWHMEEERRPGQLKRAIEVSELPNERRTTVGTAVQASYRSIAGTNVKNRRYPVLIEMGWTNLYSRKKIEGQRFLRDALFSNQNKILNIFVYFARKKLKPAVAAAKKK